MIRTLASMENPLFSQASMSAAACASRNPCRLNKVITRRRTRSVSAAKSAVVSGLAGRKEPVEEPKRRELDDAAGPRLREFS